MKGVIPHWKICRSVEKLRFYLELRSGRRRGIGRICKYAATAIEMNPSTKIGRNCRINFSWTSFYFSRKSMFKIHRVRVYLTNCKNRYHPRNRVSRKQNWKVCIHIYKTIHIWKICILRFRFIFFLRYSHATQWTLMMDHQKSHQPIEPSSDCWYSVNKKEILQ